MIKRFFELQEKVLSYYPEANTELLKKAYTIATNAHMHQKRATNEPYIIHPLAVASTLAELRLDEISIAAGLLHDVVEDSEYTIESIRSMFGEEIGDIVWGVTKISKISEFDAENAKANTLKKMIVAMTNDVRVILIKLADRLHNIGTLDALRPYKKKRIALETLEIYAPIAYRLGMGKIKDQLEDNSFKHAYPEEWKKINSEIKAKKEWAVRNLETIKSEMEKIVSKYDKKAIISYRIKREISIYRKLVKQNISLDMVYDFLALRIITDSIENCYAIMGELHQKWQHIPFRWKDFITNPKSNGYQSIHTTVFTPEGLKFEIQIRTEEMHRIAEQGIAAHWKYKEGIGFLDNDQRLNWFRDMIEFHKHNPNPKDFLSMVKKDLTPNEIYVFTPKGKVINLPAGSSPIDFAYAIHTEVGHKCKMAIVNERLVSLKTKLNSGDIVEIQTANNITPNYDWLKYCASNKAKKAISGYILKKESVLSVEKGKKIWQRAIRELKKKHTISTTEQEILQRIKEMNYPDMETFFRDLGSNKKDLSKNTLKNIFPEIKVETIKRVKKIQPKPSDAFKLVVVEGYSDIDVKLAKCCNPIKGDDVIGYITQNRGLIIHKRNCSNITNALPYKIKNVKWNDEIQDHSYLIKFDLIVDDKPGILSSISNITADCGSNIRKIETQAISLTTAKLRIAFEVSDNTQLERIYNKFKSLTGVYSVMRKRILDKSKV